jgi:hypothetical protein
VSVLLAIYLLHDSDEENGPKAGTIVRKVACSESQVGAQARPGEAMLAVPRGTIFNDLTHFIDLSGPEPVLTPKP